MTWAIIQVGGRQLASLLVFAVLGLLLAPRDFGLVGMAMAWLSVVQSFSDLGLGAALVQRRDIGPAHFSTVFVLNVGVGLLLTAVGVGLSWPSAWFFREPALQPVTMALSLNFILGSASAAQTAMAQRELRFRQLAVRDVSASLIGGGAGIVLAATGFGVWSLVAQIPNHESDRGHPDLAAVRLASATGRLFVRPPARDVALQQSTLSLQRLQVVGAESRPHSPGPPARLDRGRSVRLRLPTGGAAHRNSGWRGRRLSVSIPLPIAGGPRGPARRLSGSDARPRRPGSARAVLCAVGAPAVVPLIWGDHWAAAVPLIQVMGVQAVCQAYLSPVGQLLKSLDRPRWLLWWAVGTTATVAAFLWAGVRLGGVVGAAWGVTIAYGLGAVVIMRMTTTLIGFGAVELWRTCGKSLVAALAMAVTGWAVSLMQGTPSWFRAAALMFVPAAAYGAALLWLDQSLVRALAARLRTSPPSGARS